MTATEYMNLRRQAVTEYEKLAKEKNGITDESEVILKIALKACLDSFGDGFDAAAKFFESQPQQTTK